MNDYRRYIAIDLKSFYASVECVERGLDALDTCLVVADSSRTEKTICLAVSPALKQFGLGGRSRLFEVVRTVKEVNRRRGAAGKSVSLKVLNSRRDLAVDYIVAPPRMSLYLDYSSRIYSVYLRFVAPEDIHVYSIDEVFIDATSYLKLYGLSAHELAIKMIREVLAETGITATAGIGTNMYLSKIAMDMVAKKMPPDADGVRIAELDEMDYRRQLWTHVPLTDFWRIGKGIAGKLQRYGIMTMGDVARCSLEHEDFLYELFGVNAELLIDHAWGWEPVTMQHVRSYRPESKSICSGQVLHSPYTFAKARNVVLEMIDSASLELIGKGLATDQIVLEIGYDVESLADPVIKSKYNGKITIDRYGRSVPFHAHGTMTVEHPTSSFRILSDKLLELYDRIVNPILLVRRISMSLNHLKDESLVCGSDSEPKQLDLFTDYDYLKHKKEEETRELEKERKRQMAILNIKRRYGKNAILKGLNYLDGATQRDRNSQIGGHKA